MTDVFGAREQPEPGSRAPRSWSTRAPTGGPPPRGADEVIAGGWWRSAQPGDVVMTIGAGRHGSVAGARGPGTPPMTRRPPHQPSSTAAPGHPTTGTRRFSRTRRAPGSGFTAVGSHPRPASADAPAAPAPRGAPGTTPRAARPQVPANEQDEPPPVRVNDESKVTRVDTGQLEAVPEAGGRFPRGAPSVGRPGRRAPVRSGTPPEVMTIRTHHGGPPAPQRAPAASARRLVTPARLPAGADRRWSSRRSSRPSSPPARSTCRARRSPSAEGRGGAVRVPGCAHDPDLQAGRQGSVGDVPPGQVRGRGVPAPAHHLRCRLHQRVGVAAVEDGSSVVLVGSQGKPLSSVPAQRRPRRPPPRPAPQGAEHAAVPGDLWRCRPRSPRTSSSVWRAPRPRPVHGGTEHEGRSHGGVGDARDSDVKAQVGGHPHELRGGLDIRRGGRLRTAAPRGELQFRLQFLQVGSGL
ncbi:hypothetical protein QJS66_05500 [Kocuria rhizophila]|nr:hypothetical protein QJS66_05500 [Kocuria rhizophila]